MNIELIIATIWFLETSCSRNLNGDPNHIGPLQIGIALVEDLNQRVHHDDFWAPEDRLDKDKAFQMAREYITLYLPFDASVSDCLLLWRCGPSGRKHPNLEQLEYKNRGLRYYKQMERTKQEAK